MCGIIVARTTKNYERDVTMNFWHNGVLTPDIEKTIEFLCLASGTTTDKWTIMELEFPQADMVTGDGGKLRAAFGRVDGMVIELLQPMDDKSYHAKALKVRGPGFHHNAYICEKDQDKLIADLVASGGRIVWEMKHEEDHACYVEAAGGNIVLEIINNCPFMPD